MRTLFRRKPKAIVPVQVEPDAVTEVPDGELRMSIWDHLDELRGRMFKAVLALIVGFILGIAVATPALQFLIAPYGERLQTLGPTEAVVSYFRVALLVGGIVAVPVITYQLLAFILPGLHENERKYIYWSIGPIVLLFAIGVAFAWYIMVPPAFAFLQGFQPDIFKAEWQADQYLSFVTALLFWMGVAFESPLIFFVLSLFGMVTPRLLIQNWRIAIVATAIIAAVITPTVDPVNMALVMGPLLGLYAFSILLTAIGNRRNRAEA